MKTRKIPLWDSEHHMAPMMPSITKEIESLAVTLVLKSGELSGKLHRTTREAVSDLVRQMNCYYSNLIEGHKTLPIDIERALARNYSKDPAKRILQIEAVAHIDVQKLILSKLRDKTVNPLSTEFICWIHEEFYKRLPEEFLIMQDPHGQSHRVVPGQLRTKEVSVANHVAPAASSLPSLLDFFTSQYRQENLTPIERIVALAASHHRLLWLHPFLDGNGRVARLVVDANLHRLGLNADGLWTPSRGLARQQDEYRQYLEVADAQRQGDQGDLDGRGNLSEAGLQKFCKFFLKVCIDQVSFMSEQLEIGLLDKRIDAYVKYRAAEGSMRPEASYVLQDVIRRGSVARGEISRISGLKERTARTLISHLLKEGLLVAESPKGDLKIGLPARVRHHYFPKLYHIPLPGEENQEDFYLQTPNP